MRREGLFARLKSIALGDPELFGDGGSELRELSRVCKDVGISLISAGDETKWYWPLWEKPEKLEGQHIWYQNCMYPIEN